jgi:hypothetical protein
MRTIDTMIIGAGQARLAMAWAFLTTGVGDHNRAHQIEDALLDASRTTGREGPNRRRCSRHARTFAPIDYEDDAETHAERHRHTRSGAESRPKRTAVLPRVAVERSGWRRHRTRR